MRLNLGCGDVILPGYVNVDRRLDCGANLICDVRELPLPNNSVEDILAQDILEHFSCDETLNILREWGRVLVPGGFLTVRVPNMHKLALLIVEHWGDPFLYHLIENVYGGHRWGPGGSWDAHHWGFTPGSLHKDLEDAGFQVLTFDEEANFTTLAAWT